MLPLILLAASLLLSQQASMECVDTGATVAATETQAVRGPDGAAAVLKVSTADDHSKNSHECNADYKLVVTPANGGAPVEADFLASDGDYGRTLSLRLAGFSQDGKRLLGILAEGGKYSTTLLFDYHAGGGPVQIVDLKMQFARVAPPGCGQTLGIIGTTASGAIVMESNSEKACGPNRRWLVSAAGSKAQPLPQGASILSLYESNSAVR
ncbi:MAG TPA: hypothetical protein VN976_16690 [Verrucomicrobiae bacterium]|nr:hypothetical protein [Verrucomicrobiae bacterium]